MTYTFLSSAFYSAYPSNIYTQMEMKTNRPYAHVILSSNGLLFCIPLRSNINHPHAYFTNKKQKCGLDFSKAVVIKNVNYIDNNTKVFLRQDEYQKLLGKDYIIQQQFEKYLVLYKKALTDETVPHREKILKYSSLQYFHKELGI